MSKIIKKIDRDVRKNTIKRCREKNIIIPTYEQQKNPDLIQRGIFVEKTDVPEYCEAYDKIIEIAMKGKA